MIAVGSPNPDPLPPPPPPEPHGFALPLQPPPPSFDGHLPQFTEGRHRLVGRVDLGVGPLYDALPPTS